MYNQQDLFMRIANTAATPYLEISKYHVLFFEILPYGPTFFGWGVNKLVILPPKQWRF